MGWRGALRSIAAHQRRMEREAVRQHRQLVQQQARLEKQQALEEAAYEVALYQNQIARLTSVHRECGPVWDWKELATKPAPVEPALSSRYEDMARSTIATYRPSLLDKLFGRVKKKKENLELALQEALSKDRRENEQKREEHNQLQQDWADMVALANRILATDPTAFREAIEELNTFSEISDLGSQVRLEFTNDAAILVSLQINGEDVIPSETKTLLKSGKLSAKNMPVGQFYELYQDYVCGVTFRIARELVAFLPLRSVVVTAFGHMLDTGSGHLKDQPVLSVMIPRETIEQLNFDRLDPSDALRHFVHRMNFKRSKGFTPIEPLSWSDIPGTVPLVAEP